MTQTPDPQHYRIRKGKLTKGDKKQLEDEVKVYIDAEDGQQLMVISQQGD